MAAVACSRRPCGKPALLGKAISVRPDRSASRSVVAHFLKPSELPQYVTDVVRKQPCKLFIDGEYRDAVSGKTYDNICAFTEAPMGAVAEGDAADVDAAVHSSRAAFEGAWSEISPRKRVALLLKYADVLEAHTEELATLESVDNGKPISASRGEVALTVENFRYFAGLADKMKGETVHTDDGTLCYTLKEPVGVVGAIIPWNFPLVMYTWKVAPALAAGCCIVVKCAEQTPLTALRAAELAIEAGIPPGVVNVVPGYGPTAGAALASHPEIDKLCFTGSTEVGKLVMKEAAETIKTVSLELGGKSPLIIDKDADLDVAAQVAHIGMFLNHGQCCCASSRVYVHEDIYDAFMEKAVEMAKSIKVGNPFDADTFQGPQVDSEQFDKVLHYIGLGRDAGADLKCGGARKGDQGYYIEPTIFSDVDDGMEIATDEIFGPVMCCMKYRDLDDVLKRANSTRYGLAAGVVSKNIDTVNKVTHKLRAGTVWVNTWNTFDPAAPFGGYKESGIGRDKGEECLYNYLETKTVLVNAP